MFQGHSASLMRGQENLQGVTQTILQELSAGNLAFGFDLDGTLVHATPGDHINVPHDPVVEKLLNDLWAATSENTFVLTGRPSAFTDRLLPKRQFLVGTEHGAVISRRVGEPHKNRIGNPENIKILRRAFDKAIKEDSDLAGVQIEDHKTVTMTLGFTHIINPNNIHISMDEIDERGEMARKMKLLTSKIMSLAETILSEFGDVEREQDQIIAVDTVTPTNAVIEIMPRGACKRDSLGYLRETRLITRQFTVFCGDSGGDAKVMNAVKQEGGVCLGVGSKAPDSSAIVFEKPEHLRAYLGSIIDESARTTERDSPNVAVSWQP